MAIAGSCQSGFYEAVWLEKTKFPAACPYIVHVHVHVHVQGSVNVHLLGKGID